MRLSDDECRLRLTAADHGTLCTVHPERGVDAVPCVYAVVGDLIGIPIDTAKPKAAGRLQRERNLAGDPRATLLIDHWDRDDWSRLWWVRASLRLVDDVASDALADQLAERFPQYRDRPFARLIVLRVAALTGWSGEA